MTTGDRVLLGAVGSLGLAWGCQQWLRSRRRISLEDRVVVITGGSTGHGLVAARLAAEQGARLVIAARGEDELAAAAEDLRRAGGPEVVAIRADVTNPADCTNLIGRTLDHFGRVDVLVNNAGTIQVGPAETLTLEDFRRAMATNFWGVVHCTLAALPAMTARGFGRIANVVSVGGKLAIPHLLPYTASKFALAGFTKGLRIELARRKILVTGVYPGTMRTGGHTHALIKGDHPVEYSLFALSDTLPVLSISAERVARALWRGVCRGDAEVHVGWQTHLAPRFDALFPNGTAEALALLEWVLPAASALGVAAVRGEDVPGALPEALSRWIPPATRPGPVH